MSPFFLLDYGSKWLVPPSESPKGVGVHPHRGFETVTIAYHGKVAHNDSAGNSGVIGEGDVQWMTAAGGILHEEFHSPAFTKSGGPFRMVQLWVNLPAEFKMGPSAYQTILNGQIPSVSLPDGAGTVRVFVISIVDSLSGDRAPRGAQRRTARGCAGERLRQRGQGLDQAAAENDGAQQRFAVAAFAGARHHVARHIARQIAEHLFGAGHGILV